MQKPPAYELTEAVWTTAPAPTDINPVTPAIDHNRYNGPFGTPLNPVRYHQVLQNFTAPLQIEYQVKTAQIPLTIETDLAATRLEESMHALPPAAAIARELGVRNKVIQRKAAEQHRQTALSHGFYGSDPTDKTVYQFLSRAQILDKVLSPNGPGMNLWKQSYRAAMEARLLTQTLAVLHQQQVNVHNWLAAVQANDQAQAEAAEAARRAAEQARVDAEQQRQKDLAESACRQREQEEIRAREQERLATLAEARRLAEQLARTTAEAAARQVRAEKARLEELAEKSRQAEAENLRIERAHRAQKEQREHQREKALLAEQAVIRQQAEKNRRERLLQAELEAQERRRAQAALDDEAEAMRQAEMARQKIRWRMQTEARWEKPEFAHVGSAAELGPTFSGTLGDIATDRVSSLALTNALRTGIATAISTASAFAAPALVGFAALLVPSELGNGDLFSAGVPLSDLAPDLTGDLYELAANNGHLDLPVRLGTRTIGSRVEIVIVTTDGITVPSSISVRLAYFDAEKNAYVSSAGTSDFGPIVTWTPLIEQLDPSSSFPLVDHQLPIYEGATVEPAGGRIDPFPELDLYGFDGHITVFPIDSGIPPVLTVFRDRRQDPGVASGSGQTVSGNWLGAAATQQGAPVPTQIADKLRDREFSSFRAFRRAFWKAVSNDETLFDQFSQLNKTDVRDGLAPSARPADQLGKRKKFEIHRIKPISEGGAVYDLNNLTVLTPKQHMKLHSKEGDI
ncbi:S-type pyocin domain-containing protein [Pseudomonas sp. WC2]|uniref:S-type pyocin domain-containing protein n=1 Tax=Pseudomonas sp. WC2 TaxID=3424773 RepID=UPI003D32CD4B